MRDLLIILTPIVVVLLVLSGLISLEKLQRHRGYALILAFLISSAATPFDVISMSIMAVSMYLLYEAGLLISRLFPTR